MSERMSNAPVYYALAQVHFNPVAAMAKYVDQIQDRLRKEGYPLFEPQQVTQLVIPGPGQIPQTEPQIQHTTSWLITGNDRKAGFILSPSTMTYHTTHYETHKEFIPELLRGLHAVHEAVDLDHVSRLGLRYLDAVLPSTDETVEHYLDKGLHGVHFGAVRRYVLTESIFETVTQPLVTKGTLVTRIHRMSAPLGFPPDMTPNGLVVNPDFDIKTACEHAVIDTDHYAQGKMPIDLERIEEQLLSLHATIKSAFNTITTDHARDIWTGESR
ncbi:MAG: TIGR04255 family protein [Nitrincola lacisaponensis]|uniref:TIGR04255 family protein n=1 Tax=Nitrincola lacisaponensis TaxID=267850 RepID=UPI00391D850A